MRKIATVTVPESVGSAPSPLASNDYSNQMAAFKAQEELANRAMVFGFSGVVKTENDPRTRGYSVAELHAVFNTICNPVDWKFPVDSEVHPSLLGLALASVEFHTATAATIAGINPETGRIRITAPGYYAGPAN